MVLQTHRHSTGYPQIAVFSKQSQLRALVTVTIRSPIGFNRVVAQPDGYRRDGTPLLVLEPRPGETDADTSAFDDRGATGESLT
jgi:hypothetical protein